MRTMGRGVKSLHPPSHSQLIGKCGPSGRRGSPGTMAPVGRAKAQGPWAIKSERFGSNLVVITVFCANQHFKKGSN